MVLFSVESENGAVLTYRLGKTQITVGSSSRNDIVVRSAGVAERHLVIHRNQEVFTFVTVDRQTVVLNGERRARGVLNPGDRLRLGTMTLIFRGSDGEVPDLVVEEPATAQGAGPQPPREPLEPVSYRPDPAGFPEARLRLMELFQQPRGDRLQQLVALLREALPETESAIVAPGEGEGPVALASVWTGELPRFSRRVLNELAAGGRYAVLNAGDTAVVTVPVLDSKRDVVAMLLSRPAGSLGDEGVGLLCEAARLLRLRWQDVEREDTTFTGWELEARHRLEALLPGSSQATQVLRAGMLAGAHANEPVLVCGAPGTGRTEVARILATLGPIGGRSVTVCEAHDGDVAAVRQELFGPVGHPTFGPEAGGVVGQARGGVLVVRNIDRYPLPLQSELAALIAAQQREPLSSSSTRWVVTCGEDPLALVQQGKLAAPLFMVFAQRLLRVPRLSERREDLPLLIASLLRRAAADQQKNLRGITLECLNLLLARPFPGEMSDLVAEIHRLVTATPDGEMVRCDTQGLAAGVVSGAGDVPVELAQVLASDNLKEAIPQIEQLLIDRVMRRVKGNQSKGARILGISRGALITKLKEYGVPDYRYLRRRRGAGL